MGAGGCGFLLLIFYRNRGERKRRKDILRANFKCCHIKSRLTSLWRNVTTCVRMNNPIIYIKMFLISCQYENIFTHLCAAF